MTKNTSGTGYGWGQNPNSYNFKPGNQCSKLRATKKLRITELKAELDKHNFDVIPEMIGLYRDAKTPANVKASIIIKIADKIYPSLRSVEVDMSADVSHNETIDTSKLSTDELKAIMSIDPALLGKDDEDEDTDDILGTK